MKCRSNFVLLWSAAILSGCGSQPPRPVTDRSLGQASATSASPPATVSATPAPRLAKPARAVTLKQGGGFYKDDGPGEFVPEDVDAIPDAVPRTEALHRFANNPYSVFGRDYTPLKKWAAYRERGIGSWYGKKFHGQKTSSGEVYDMYGMTAAHPTLPIPSYVRVSRPGSGRAVVVRVNDRGPFHSGRLIDLSWTAAYKLGYLGEGSTVVDVELIRPGQVLPPLADNTVAKATVDPVAVEDSGDPLLRLTRHSELGNTIQPRPLIETRDMAGHYIQLGAFGNRDNAETLRSHLSRELGDLSEKLVVQPMGKLFRVQLGPWPDAASARRAGDHLRESFGMAPVFVQR